MLGVRDLNGGLAPEESQDDLAEWNGEHGGSHLLYCLGQLGVLGVEIGGELRLGGLDNAGGSTAQFVAAPPAVGRAEQIAGNRSDVPVGSLGGDPGHSARDPDERDLGEIFGRVVGKAVSEVR
jgi:hypothetical protein